MPIIDREVHYLVMQGVSEQVALFNFVYTLKTKSVVFTGSVCGADWSDPVRDVSDDWFTSILQPLLERDCPTYIVNQANQVSLLTRADPPMVTLTDLTPLTLLDE